jgi:hypothetical protein
LRIDDGVDRTPRTFPQQLQYFVMEKSLNHVNYVPRRQALSAARIGGVSGDCFSVSTDKGYL